MGEYSWIIDILSIIIFIVICIVLVETRKVLNSLSTEIRNELRQGREELRATFKDTNETLVNTLKNMSEIQQNQLAEFKTELKDLNESNTKSLDNVRNTLNEKVKELQDSNEKKLEEMRKTVDEKLHDTLEKRLGESFKLVSERLEAVHNGLGEMKNLATGVGDLKRVLSNVKHRGTLGEVQLGSILEEILAPQQYEKNVATKVGSSERVEYAIKLPGTKENPDSRVWLPIDSKFPQEDFLRLQEVSETGDPVATQKIADELMKTVLREADSIAEKYINPPETTDIAIMFVPTEGLYAEIVRHPNMLSELNKKRVFVAGPSTLAAILNGLRMGFQTLAISERASEVWQVLKAVKTEFGKFGGVLAKVKKQLGTATRTIEATETRTRAMERSLRAVEELPAEEANKVLSLPDFSNEEDYELEETDFDNP